MNKFIIIALALMCSFSCTRKSIYMTNKELKETLDGVQEIIDRGPVVDTLGSIYYKPDTQITIDTGGGNVTKYTDGTILKLDIWEPKLDTSDVIIKYVFNWEEGEIETLACKAVYPTSRFGIWLGVAGEGSKLFKVKDGIWIPIEWPKDPVELYIKPKK